MTRSARTLFALGLLPGFVELTHPSFGFGTGFEMAAVARNLVGHGVYGNPFAPFLTGPTAVVPPLYPLYLAALLAIFKPTAMAAVAAFIGILVNALIAALLPRLALVFYGDRRPGIFAGVLWIVSCRLLPNWDVNHTIAGLVLFCLATAGTVERPRRAALWGAGAGIIAGLLLLLNPATILISTPWLAWLLFARRIPPRRAALYAAMAALAAAACLFPWILRNYRVLGAPVLRTNLGMTLYSSNNDCAQPSLFQDAGGDCYASMHPVGSPTEAALLRTLGEAPYDTRRTADALQWIRRHPARFGQLTRARIFEFWFPEPVGPIYPAYGMWLVTVLSIAGFVGGIRRREPITWFLAFVWLVYPLAYYAVVSCDRYRYPVFWTSLMPAGYWLASRVRSFRAGWVRRWAPVGAVLAIGAVTAATGASHIRLFGHDTFFLLDNGWRALRGERVHVDYSSAWGPLTFLLVAAGMAVSGGAVAAVNYAHAFAAVSAGLWSAWLAAGRSRGMMAIACPCFVALLVAAPFVLGQPPVWTSDGMVYNRYGYALVTILMLECFLPGARRDTLGARWLEPGLTGCALGLLLFLKITFFLVAVPLLGMSLLFRAPRGRRALAHAVGFIVTALLFLAYLRFDVGAMWRDLLTAAAARSGSLDSRFALADVAAAGIALAGALGVLTWWCRRRFGPAANGQSLWRGWCYPLAAVLVAAADSLLLLTNAQGWSYPLTAAFAIVLLLSAEPAAARSSRKAAWVLALTAGLLAGPMTVLEGFGLGYGFIESRANPDPPGVLRFESARLHPLVLYDVLPDNVDRFANGREYVASVNDGVWLLAAHTRPEDKIATLDMFNPFSYALGREPIRGGIAAAAYRYTLDDRHHPSAARFFADAAVVMVPKYPAAPPIFYDGYRKIYEPALETEFRLEAESSRWRLYRRLAGEEACLR